MADETGPEQSDITVHMYKAELGNYEIYSFSLAQKPLTVQASNIKIKHGAESITIPGGAWSYIGTEVWDWETYSQTEALRQKFASAKANKCVGVIDRPRVTVHKFAVSSDKFDATVYCLSKEGLELKNLSNRHLELFNGLKIEYVEPVTIHGREDCIRIGVEVEGFYASIEKSGCFIKIEKQLTVVEGMERVVLRQVREEGLRHGVEVTDMRVHEISTKDGHVLYSSGRNVTSEKQTDIAPSEAAAPNKSTIKNIVNRVFGRE